MSPEIVNGKTSQGSQLFAELNRLGVMMNATSLELKYCERCGALGVRRPDSNHNYCRHCAGVLTMQVSIVHLARRAARFACTALETASENDTAAAEVLL